MEKKSDMVRRLVQSGDFKAALRIAKDFRLGISKVESDAMKLAYECMVHGRFYQSLGYNLNEKVEEGLKVLTGLYGRSCKSDLHQQICQPGT